ncbi:MAG: SDR family NAD(P)-dependent oxidoreductase, partial [Promethearchaeota archaeon]
NPNVNFMQADLSLMSETRRIAEEISSKYPKIDILINNAGIFTPTRHETTEGFELTFALNYLSPFLLTQLLLPLLSKSTSGQILCVTSIDHKLGKIRFNDLQTTKYTLGQRAYSQSKLALVMFELELLRRLTKLENNSIRINVIHPGIVRTKITTKTPGFEGWITKILAKWLGISKIQSAEYILEILLSPKFQNLSGVYFSKNKVGKASFRAKNKKKIMRLWEISEKLTGIKK